MYGLEFTDRQKLALAALVGIGLMGIGVGASRNARKASLDTLATAGDRSQVEIRTESGRWQSRSDTPAVVVHVAGSVKNPNVYVMKPGDRVIDAVRKAGGPKAGADVNALNLAAVLKDGEKVYVPSFRESAPPAATASSIAGSRQGARAAAAQGPVNVNTAGPEEMDRLPGVGPATAQKIIDYRNQHGRFTSIDQLDEVSGIGPKKLEEMRPFVTL